MKQGRLLSLILATTLFITPVANAGEPLAKISTKAFEKQYPHVNQTIRAMLYTIAKTMPMLGLQSFNDGTLEKYGERIYYQLSQCTAGFDTPANLYAIQNYIQSNFSQAELIELETYYASSAGQKDTARLKAYGDRYSDDGQIFQKLVQKFPTDYEFIQQSGEDGKKIEAFRGSDLNIKFTDIVLSNNISETDVNDCVDDIEAQWEKES